MSETQLTTTQEKPRALTPISMDGGGVRFSNFDELVRFCVGVNKSRLAPKGLETPEAIMVAVQHGAELGLGPMAALQSIAVINGRPCVWGDAAAALCRAHKDCEDIVEEISEETATCTATRKGCKPVVRSFSVADAKRAGLWGKAGPWTQYPRRMLQMRARSWALRDAFPDALKGVGIREEVQDHSRPEPKPLKAILLPSEPAPEAFALEDAAQ